MTDIRIATDYLQDLFERLDAKRIDPALADWVFAHEAWQVVCGEIERLRGARDRLSEEIAIEQQEAGALYEQMAKLTEERDAALEAVRAWELASELEMKPGTGEGG